MARVLLCGSAQGCTRPVRRHDQTPYSHTVTRQIVRRTGFREHEPKPSRHTVARSYYDAYEEFSRSPIFRSDLVQQEADQFVKEMSSLSKLLAKFPDFDLAGKKTYLVKMEELCERYEIFIKRLELSQDPAAKEFLRVQNAQMLESGFSIKQFAEGMKQSLTLQRMWVDQEERYSSDPAAHLKFLEDMRSQWSSIAVLSRLHFPSVLNAMDPRVVSRAVADQQYWVAMKDIITNPSPATMAKWVDHPNLGPLVAEMWKQMQRST